jgi:Ca-activated chloride channel family protein
LLFIPVILYFRKKRGKPLVGVKFSSTHRVAQLPTSLRQRLMFLPLAMRILALVFLVFALARPQIGREKIRDVSKGIAIQMVVDRSGSMATEMYYEGQQLNRLEVVKRVFEEFVNGGSKGLEGRPNDLVGMIAFARYADTICPLTLSHGALSRFLENIKLVQHRSEDGTSIGDALALATARLKTAEQEILRQAGRGLTDYQIKSKVIVLLTDGQNNFGKRTPIEAAALAKKWGIKVYAIGVGGGEGFITIQTPFGARKIPVRSGVDKATLKAIAEETGGIFRQAVDTKTLREVYKEIDNLEKSEIESIGYLDYKEAFVPFALIALLFLILEILLSNTVFRKIP